MPKSEYEYEYGNEMSMNMSMSMNIYVLIYFNKHEKKMVTWIHKKPVKWDTT